MTNQTTRRKFDMIERILCGIHQQKKGIRL